MENDLPQSMWNLDSEKCVLLLLECWEREGRLWK